MICTFDQFFRGQYIQLRTLFISLCLNSPDIYSFNILIIITLFYNMCIEYEIYNFAYNNFFLYDSLFIYGTMGEWDDIVTLLEIRRNLGH